MASNISAFKANSMANGASFTTASLRRWSCGERNLPQVDKIKSLHVYDFDNTLFATPLPNRQLWKGDQIGHLQNQDAFVNGGWWHDASILAATGQGIEKEEPNAWAGWWNEDIVNLIELSMEQPDTLTVLLTGRSESQFQSLIRRILDSRKLEFDLIALKPMAGPSNEKFGSTQKFKQAFLEALVNTYNQAGDIRIYEDRIKHVRDFRDFFSSLNARLADVSRMGGSSVGRTQPLNAEVVEVAERTTTLDPATEIATIQRMINVHNAAFAASDKPLSKTNKPFILRKTVFYSGYLISPDDTERLLQLPTVPVRSSGQTDIRFLANSVMIRFGPTPESILAKAGGLGHKVTWRCVAIGSYENKIWAIRLEPVPANTPYYTEGQPTVVLALQGNARPFEAGRIHKWTSLSPEHQITFDTTVGEKVQLRIDEERAPDGYTNKPTERPPNSGKRSFQDDFPPLSGGPIPTGPSDKRPQGAPSGPKNPGRGGNVRAGSNRGARGGHGRGGRGGGRGKGMFYHSLDDMGDSRGGVGANNDGADDRGLTY